MRNARQLLKKLPHRQSFQIAWPMIVSNMSIPIMGMADTAMLGHLDHARFLAAATLGTSVVALCYWMFAFLRMSTTSATAHAEGANNFLLAAKQFTANSYLALAGGLLLISINPIFLPFILSLMTSDQTLHSLALEYSFIRIFSAPAVLITFVAMGWLIGTKRTRTALVITVLSNILNILLDFVFIVLLQLDVKGAATATLIAEYAACAGALAFVLRDLHQRQYLSILFSRIKRELLVQTFHVNSDLFLRTLAILFAFNFFHAQGAKFGEEILAANAIIMQWVLFTAFFLDGYALAAETLTANAIGARKIEQFHYASFASIIASAVIACGLTFAYLLAMPWLLPLFSDIAAVQDLVREYSLWLFVMPLVSVWCYSLDGIYVGASKTRVMRNHMAAALFIVFLPVWWLLKPFQNHGLWLSFVLFNGFRGLSLGCAYWMITRRNGWLAAVYKNDSHK